MILIKGIKIFALISIIFKHMRLLSFSHLVFLLVSVTTIFPGISQCERLASSQPDANYNKQNSKVVSSLVYHHQNNAKSWPNDFNHDRKIRHANILHLQKRRRAASATVELEQQEESEFLKTEKDNPRRRHRRHPSKPTSILQHQLPLPHLSSPSEDFSTLSNDSQIAVLTAAGETDDDFPDGYWVRIAQAKVLALAVENGILPKLDEYTEIMTATDCRKDDYECKKFTLQCAGQITDRILQQLSGEHRQATKENVTLYMNIILRECDFDIIRPNRSNDDDIDNDSDYDQQAFSFFGASSSPPANTPVPLPVFHCNDRQAQNNVVTNFRMEYATPNLHENLTSDMIPRYFVIEISHGGGRWSLTTKPVQPFWLFPFKTETDHSYQIRVTAVSPKYVYRPVSSDILTIYNSSELTFDKPKQLHVVHVKMDYESARPSPSALLRWKSGSGNNASCNYQVFYMDDDDFEVKETKNGGDAFWVKLNNLQFSRNYSVQVIEKFGHDKEANASTHLLVPSCLEMRQFSFNLCSPTPPSNVRMENITDDSFLIVWNPPKYLNATNRILYYNVTVTWIDGPTATTTATAYTSPFPSSHGSYPIPSSSGLSVGGEAQFFGQRHHYKTFVVFTGNLPGNVTCYQMANVTKLRGQFKISVTAVGVAGPSQPCWDVLYYKGSLSSNLSAKNILSIVFSLAGGIALVTLFCLFKHFYDRRQRQKKRQETFENYERESLQLEQIVESEKNATKWEIECCHLDIREGIGKGNFGLVRRAILNHNGRRMTVAVKTLRDGVDSKEVEKLWEEYEILKNLDPHVHVVGLKGIVTKHLPMPLLVVEYCDGGDLQSHLRKTVQSVGFYGARRYSPMMSASASSSTLLSVGSSHSSLTNQNNSSRTAAGGAPSSARLVTNAAYFLRNDGDHQAQQPPPLTVADLLSYARQVAVGMEYLSSNKIVHRDLAARNILVSGKSKILKISDFGLSRDVYEQNWYKKNSKGEIPIKWLALESILTEIYTTKSDVWSYGILLWEIFTYGGNPYPGVDNSTVFDLLKDGYRMCRPETCPVDLYELMRICWNDEPKERPNFTGIRLVLEEIIEKITHVTYLNLDSTTRPAAISSFGSSGPVYKNCDSGFDEYDDSTSASLTNEPMLPPRNRRTSDGRETVHG